MAVILLAQRLPQGVEDSARSSAGILSFEPGSTAELPDEVTGRDWMRLFPGPPRCPELRCQRSGKIYGEVPGLAFAELGRQSFQNCSGDIC